MDPLIEIQHEIFEQIKGSLPPNIALVQEVASVLDISTDSAYRRIRGEKMISLEELYRLATRFHISVDSLFDLRSGKKVFSDLAIEPGRVTIREWLMHILGSLQAIATAPERSIVYAAKDVPFFHYFLIPELAAFKMFFWEKTLFRLPGYEGKKFALNDADGELLKIGKDILKTYQQIPSTEIWNEDTFYIMLRQMEYYWVSGLFSHTEEIWLLCDRLSDWIRHLQLEAEHGSQFMFGEPPSEAEGSFRLYVNEVVLNDNSVLARAGEDKMLFLSYHVVNLLTTNDPALCAKTEEFFKGLIRQSVQISASAAKERQRFFNHLINQLDRFREKIARMADD